jgi:hypothetical protein
MKKLCGLTVFTVLFFTIQSFGGNPVSSPTGNKLLKSPPSLTIDTTKKVAGTDTSKADDDDDSTADNERSYAIGLVFGSDQSYHGVQSKTKLPYIEPNFTYTAPSGFYTEVLDQDFLLGKGQKYNALAINPGWNIDVADNTTLNFNLTHYFIGAHPAPAAITSDVSNSFETYVSQDIGETEGKLSIDYDYYKKTASIKTPNDWVITPDINHTFKIKLSKKSSLSIIPEGTIDFGTRNLFSHAAVNSGADTLLNTPTATLTKQEKKEQVAEQEKLTTSNSSFGTLDYNLILSIDYKLGNFEIEPALNYTNPLYRPVGQVNKPLGYGTITLTYTIY